MIFLVALTLHVIVCAISYRLGPIVLGPWACPERLLGHAWVWPFIALRDPHDARTRQHERIHHAQQCELLVLGFYVLYPAIWLALLAWHRSFHWAYWLHPMERAAARLDARPYSWLRRA